jgi:uncharacterized membrane protein
MSRDGQQVRHTRIFVQFVLFWAALQLPEQRRSTLKRKVRSAMNKYAYAFGLLFVILSAVYLIVSSDLQGAVLLFSLGIAMATMTLILIHAMTTDS